MQPEPVTAIRAARKITDGRSLRRRTWNCFMTDPTKNASIYSTLRKDPSSGGLPCSRERSRIVRSPVMTAFLFTCEHATCAVPEAYRECFRGNEEALHSSEGWEPGALNLTQFLGMMFRTPVVHGDVSRLLIDLSKEGDDRWSRFSKELPEPTRQKLADRYERAFRTAMRQRINEHLRRGERLLHVRVHTRPWEDGRVVLTCVAQADTSCDVADVWRESLMLAGLDARLERAVSTKEPASTESDTTAPIEIRLEVSQSFFLEGRPWKWDTLRRLLGESLEKAASQTARLNDPESPGSPES